ncbi:MAG: TetR/AcrR family transcriptional regulator [Cyanobacteria bacterium]|nr:TetR/AcrR family transcriptional regulator [Cyanobacteriota bacterium]MDA0865223.1 TetR/AcrR family transcriptional regulator [Cyanobacteriota bacterium]
MPKIVDHDRYRKELLNQCLALFAAQGYGSITMRQIAQGLGVSTGTLYHYFPSKESILEQLVQDLCEQGITDFFAQAPPAERVGDRLRIVIEFFLAHYRFYQQQLLLWVDFHQHSQRKGTERQAFLQRFWQRTHAQLVAYLQLPNPAHVDFVLVFMDGLLLQCLYERGEAEADWVTQQTELLIALLDSA